VTSPINPEYAYDLDRLRRQVDRLRTALPAAVEVLYSFKANASLGICDVFADAGLGADVASAGELATAIEAGFRASSTFVAGPYKSPETLERLRSLPEAVVSIDSLNELRQLGSTGLPQRAVLRLRPDFGSSAVVAAGPEARFGVPGDQLAECREVLATGNVNLVGFHVFAGSQVLDAAGVIEHLRGSVALCEHAAETTGVTVELLNLGGGFGIPYAADEQELDLAAIAGELDVLIERVAPARIVLELGRYLVAQAGWYLVSVVGAQVHRGRPALVVDGGTHQRADLCGIGLSAVARPPLVLDPPTTSTVETDVLGCLSLPADVLAESCLLPELAPGTVLAFADAGAYGLWSSPASFHAYPLPAEVAFEGQALSVMREPRSAASILDDQLHVIEQDVAVGREPKN